MATQLSVKRWTRHGHDRLYVETASGIKVGWFDLKSSKHQLQVPGMWPEFQAAITQWRTGNDPQPPTPRRSQTKNTGDLAERKAGEFLQRRAESTKPRNTAVRLAARLFGIRTADYAWRTGAKGEQRVGAKLDPLLKHGWHVLHGVQLGLGGDIDHLIIGPYGVFTVNTKHHPSARIKVGDKVIFVSGRQAPYIGKACREAQRVREALAAALGYRLHVGPLIVVHGHRGIDGWMRNRPQGVLVLPSWAISWWCKLPGHANLSPTQIAEVFAVARQPGTWRSA